MNLSLKSPRLLQTAIILALVVILVLLLVISTQSTDELNYLDNFWYLNRARLIWRGILPDLFVYTLTYPTVVGLVNLFINDVLLAGMMVNTALLWLLLFGVYVLAFWLYGSRRAGWLAVVLVLINASFLDALRLFWATISFTTVTLWCVIAALWMVRRPTIFRAALIGGLLALATYTRIEGAIYTLIVPVAAWAIYKSSGLRTAITVCLISGIVYVVLCIPFALNFLDIQRNIDAELSTAVTGVFTLLDRTPIEWSVIWRRVTDTLTGFLSHWTALAWLVGIAGVIWASPRYRTAQIIGAALIGLNLLYTFVLSIWPYPIHLIFYLPFFGVMLAGALMQLADQGIQAKRLAIVLLALMLLPNVVHFARRAVEVPIMAYRTSELAATGKALDTWLIENGYEGTPIYTFCGSIPSFSHAPMQLIYRLQYTTGWDRPERLIPRLEAENALLMVCGNEVHFPDWRPLLLQDVPDGFREVGRFENHIFYRPDGSVS